MIVPGPYCACVTLLPFVNNRIYLPRGATGGPGTPGHQVSRAVSNRSLSEGQREDDTRSVLGDARCRPDRCHYDIAPVARLANSLVFPPVLGLSPEAGRSDRD